MYQPKMSHLGPQVAGEEGGTPSIPYLAFSRRVTVPPYTEMEHRDGPKKPMRKKLYPSREKIDIFVTDRGSNVWKCEVTAEQHNINRKRPGGRDETWPDEEFLVKFQQAFQFPTKNEYYIFLFKENPDSDSLTLNIKERSGKVVINYNNPAVLEKCGEQQAGQVLAAALAEENNLFRTYCMQGRFDLIKLFVKNGVSIDAIYDDCWSPLQFTIQYGHEEISKWLILRGCDLLRVSPDGRYPLGMVVEQGSLDLLKLLARQGVQLHEETYENMDIETPMMLATLHQHKHIVEWMCGPQGYRTLREAKKVGPRNTSKGTTMFETVEGHYPQVWGVTAGVDDGIREGMYA
jgi:hypothetical protein